MKLHITKDELINLVKNQSIETVITDFPDMYGRLVGKDLTAIFL